MTLHWIDQRRDHNLQPLAADPAGALPQHLQRLPQSLVVQTVASPFLLRGDLLAQYQDGNRFLGAHEFCLCLMNSWPPFPLQIRSGRHWLGQTKACWGNDFARYPRYTTGIFSDDVRKSVVPLIEIQLAHSEIFKTIP